MNTRQKELAIVALELGATVWISVDGDVCAAWMAGDNTAYNFFYDNVKGTALRKQLGKIETMSISGTDNDVVTF